MKTIKNIILVSSLFLVLTGCDENFGEVNTNPYAITDVDPSLLFANAVRLTHAGGWEQEQTIVQQFVNAYNLGATAGFNFNEDNDNFNNGKWNSSYGNSVKLLTQGMSLLSKQPERVNLMSMMRLWKAYVYMTLVDTYGHVPYSEAGRAYLDGVFYPKYDDDSAIYDDLYIEIKSATAALNGSADYVREDLFYKSSGSAAAQVTKWRKLGNSLLLRLGMRYSKLNPSKAKSIVSEAINGGVMELNSDDAYLAFNSVYNNDLNSGPRTINPYFYYLAEPFVNQLKLTSDPRSKFISGKYANPNAVLASSPDTAIENQYGFPVGYDSNTIKNKPGYRGEAGTGLNYSQLNFNVIASAIAPVFYITNAQTKLLMAEAAQRGWITGNAKQLYEDGIIADMDHWSLYPNTPNPAVSLAEKNAYLTNPNVAYNVTDALKLINTQYWISNIGNGAESFANFRRSGFPTLTPNAYNNNLNGGFARRMAYPESENTRNLENLQAAITAFGPDNLTTRVFWDIP